MAVKYLSDLNDLQKLIDKTDESQTKTAAPKDYEALYEQVADSVNRLAADYEEGLIQAGVYYDVTVYCRKPLANETKQQIVQAIEEKWGPHHLIEYEEDETLDVDYRYEKGELVFDTTYYKELLNSFTEDIAIKYLNDLEVIQELVDGIREHVTLVKDDPAAYDEIQKVLQKRVDHLVSDFEESLIQADIFYRVSVQSAKPLSDAMKRRILDKVEARWGRYYLVEYIVDPRLIGGIRLEVGESIFDTTYRSRIDQMLREV